MNWLFKILDAAGVNIAKVDANGSVQATGPATKAQAGFQAIAGRNDDGVATGTPLVNRWYVTEGQGGRMALAAVLWDDTFNATAQNLSKYRTPNNVNTTTFPGGTMNLVGTTVSGQNCAIQTYKHFPLFGKSELRCNMAGFIVVTPQLNNVVEIGLFSAALAGAAAPTDGVFFRWNALGELRGVISYNGTETQTAAIANPSLGVNHDFTIVIQTNVCRFYIDDVLYGSVTMLTDAPTLGQPMMMGSQPLTMRNYNTGTVSSLQTFRCSDVFITSLGPDFARDFATMKAGFGHMAYQGQNGHTQGTTAQYAPNANPAAAVPTNTTAALGTGLGGKFQETVTLVAGTDGIISSYQNPVPAVGLTGRNLIITGITISGVVTVVMPATALTGSFALNYGHTAVSLATADSATGTSPATKAPRRIALGAVGLLASAAVGTVIPPQTYKFAAPVVVAPGEFAAISRNNITAAPASGAIMWSIQIDGYFE